MDFTGERFIPGQHVGIELEHLNRYYFVVNQIDLAGKKVLDIASGEGYGSQILSQYAKHVTGVDISSEAIDYSNEKYQSPNLNFLLGDAARIPLDNNSVDVVVSFETIEHHDKHIEMMNEIKRVLNPEGILVISSPDKDFFLNEVKNEFHIKELYSNEFKELIGQFFKKSFFYSQKIFSGSMIVLDQYSDEYQKPIVISADGLPHDFTAVYNLAISTDVEFFRPNNQMVMYQKFNEVLSYADLHEAVHAVTKSKAYRLGKLILKPFSYIRNKMNI